MYKVHERRLMILSFVVAIIMAVSLAGRIFGS